MTEIATLIPQPSSVERNKLAHEEYVKCIEQSCVLSIMDRFCNLTIGM